jgi:CHAD domain-containing protein
VREIEAKFLVRNPLQLDQLFELIRGAGYVVEPERNETFVDHYYDTSNWTLLRAGWAYRCRDRDGECTVGLKKFSLGEGPVQVREEVEQRVLIAHTGRDLPSGPVRDRLSTLVNGAQPDELFSIRNQRLLCTVVAPNDAARIELAIDQAHVVAEETAKKAPGVLEFTELELELKQGRREPLERLVKVLTTEADLLPARLSKFERGLQAAGLSAPPDAQENTPPGPGEPLIRVAHYHLRRQFELLRFQQPRAWEGLDTDGVHQMRVATRRLRAALRVFRNVLSERTRMRFNEEFRWLGDALGAVRDLDVYRDDLVHYMAAIPPNDAQSLLPYHHYLLKETQKARRRLIAALASKRYARLLDRFGRFIERGPSRTALRRFRMRVGSIVASDVDDRLKTVLKHGRRLSDHLSAEGLHALRSRCKRLRYTLEFFADLCPKVLRGAIGATTRLQDLLGTHQDAWVATSRLRSYASTVSVRARDRGLLLSLGQLIQSQEQYATEERERFHHEWRRFKKDMSRKKLRAALADLGTNQ